ncbi:hypothetical protein NECAME_05496 [Necator americanus]|uniref:Uncharacterized protein n=1 Tax=Necator americanus TaxID=51031 RepID=W2SIE7_NECAM|nr:hypothetical protein NECAME_05496 [Necator americanus]ETN68651.1 hypothetical protein NECAME_05496 [Necator americanus]
MGHLEALGRLDRHYATASTTCPIIRPPTSARRNLINMQSCRVPWGRKLLETHPKRVWGANTGTSSADLNKLPKE